MAKWLALSLTLSPQFHFCHFLPRNGEKTLKYDMTKEKLRRLATKPSTLHQGEIYLDFAKKDLLAQGRKFHMA